MSEAVSKERSHNYLRQIKGAVVYKAVAMAASFLAIPLMIRYLGQEQFGVWSTLLTVMSWIVFFDLGVGNGLRNKVAEALAKNDKAEAANYIASGYSLIGLIALLLWAAITAASFFIPWQSVFNTHAIAETTLRLTVQIATFFVALNFWIGLIAALLGALQKTSLTALGQLISNVLALMLVFVLTQTTAASITKLAFVYGISLVTANILLSLHFYQRNPELRPKPYLDKQHASPLLSVGLQFFIIQLAVLVIFTTDKMLITQLFGPQHVTQYEVVFKLFSVISFAHTLITAPLWSAYTDAYHRSDLTWIKSMLRKQIKIFAVVILAAIMMIFLAKPLISVWIGPDVNIPLPLVIAMSLLVLVSTWNNIFGSILGGISKIRLGSIYTVFTALLNIPISYFMAVNIGLGTAGIVLGTLISISVSAIISPIQVYFFIYEKSKNSFLVEVLR
ncbi:MAG: oligosaccharide flippase family protein [Methylobacter sp.]|nr:oligosaccharide flippase family protein [Methylobacter sp.]MDP2100516.1 oligosaccharide flippase family protein [Methylobacter sp.]MDP2428731.1 oligosaccharide flippase family protein [Methylobacter sp.]MDP3053253.1 oligosaccharide flippase family protein [Methylobacter sp.]MDZ4219404.1 oligosaccharide flippase family protein [Methylobacter sp.]